MTRVHSNTRIPHCSRVGTLAGESSMRNTQGKTNRILAVAVSAGFSLGMVLALAGCERMEATAQRNDREIDARLAQSAVDNDSGRQKGADPARKNPKEAQHISS